MFICNIYIFLDCNSFMVDLNFQDLKSAETHLRTKAYHTLNIWPESHISKLREHRLLTNMLAVRVRVCVSVRECV